MSKQGIFFGSGDLYIKRVVGGVEQDWEGPFNRVLRGIARYRPVRRAASVRGRARALKQRELL